MKCTFCKTEEAIITLKRDNVIIFACKDCYSVYKKLKEKEVK